MDRIRSLLLSLSHYYGLFVAVGLLCWLAVRPTTGDSGVVERIRVRAVPLMTGGVAIASVAPSFVWHRARSLPSREPHMYRQRDIRPRSGSRG